MVFFLHPDLQFEQEVVEILSARGCEEFMPTTGRNSLAEVLQRITAVSFSNSEGQVFLLPSNYSAIL